MAPKMPGDRARATITSEAALQAIALRYVARFPCSTHKLRVHLGKKLEATIATEVVGAQVARRWIDGVVASLTRMRALDDVGFAQARAVTLHCRGRATRIIEQDLRRAGLPVAAIEGACRALVELAPEPDLTAAIALARKKRLGPFARGPLDDGARRRQLALLARAGFSFAVARRIVDCRDAQLLEE